VASNQLGAAVCNQNHWWLKSLHNLNVSRSPVTNQVKWLESLSGRQLMITITDSEM
jgi:hypothetical protein